LHPAGGLPLPPHRAVHHRRAALAVLFVVGLGSTVLAAPRVNAASEAGKKASSASQADSASLRKEAQRLEDRLEATGERLSQLAEDWNEANERLAVLEEQTSDATADLAAAESLIRNRERAAKSLALGQYTGGGANGTFGGLDTDLSMEANTRREVYSAIGLSNDRDVLDRLRADREDLDRLKNKLAKRKAAIATQRAAVKRAADQAQALEAEQTQLLAQTKGRLGKALEAEEKRRRAAEEAAVKKRLDAQIKAAETKAREVQATKEREVRDRAANDEATKGKAGSGKATGKAGTGKKSDAALSPRLRTSGSGQMSAAEARASAAQAEADLVGSAGGGSPPLLPPSDEEPAVPGAEKAIAIALSQVGKPYQWGATGPGSFDCSGLMMYSWRAAGRSIPRSSRTQFAGTRRVSVSQIKPGDLVFFGRPIHHVGMYIGNGQMVEASRRGVPVRVRSIFRKDLVGVGRIQ
jgi:peptidoglycan DL-endopeptidase CwlO